LTGPSEEHKKHEKLEPIETLIREETFYSYVEFSAEEEKKEKSFPLSVCKKKKNPGMRREKPIYLERSS